MTEHDAFYLQEDYYGPPSEDMMRFFSSRMERGRLLDVGCGQGRNALPLAKMGYDVTGIDASKVGIGQMIEKARSLNLNLSAIQADIFNYVPDALFDVILMDNMIHFTPEKVEEEKKLITDLTASLKQNAMFCISFFDAELAPSIFRQLFRNNWEEILQKKIRYSLRNKEEYQQEFLVFKKTGNDY